MLGLCGGGPVDDRSHVSVRAGGSRYSTTQTGCSGETWGRRRADFYGHVDLELKSGEGFVAHVGGGGGVSKVVEEELLDRGTAEDEELAADAKLHDTDGYGYWATRAGWEWRYLKLSGGLGAGFLGGDLIPFPSARVVVGSRLVHAFGGVFSDMVVRRSLPVNLGLGGRAGSLDWQLALDLPLSDEGQAAALRFELGGPLSGNTRWLVHSAFIARPRDRRVGNGAALGAGVRWDFD